MTQEIEYGPFVDGYFAAGERTEAGRQAITADSVDVGIDPSTGAIYKRRGSAIVGDTYPTPAGLLESKWGARCRQVFPLRTLTLAQATHAALYTDDADVEGQVYFRGAAANMVLGKSYGATHRPTTLASVWNLQVQPLMTEHATQIFTRLKDGLSRRVIAPGAARVLTVGPRMYVFPLKGTPFVWNGRFNEASGSGSEKERIRVAGPAGPVFPVRITATTAAATLGPFLGKHTFYYSYVYVRADGSRTLPFIGQPISATLTNGLGYFKVDTNAAHAAWGAAFLSVTVPIGPPDTVARILCRTSLADESAGDVPDPLTLKVCGVILNNTQTAYIDSLGDDGLRENPSLVRYDYIMPPRAGVGPATADGRIVIADLSPNPCAIQLAPYCIDGAFADTYGADDVGSYSNHRYYFRVTAANLYLKHDTPNTVDLTIALAGKTLYQVVDEINAVTPVAGHYAWRAQLMPGMDGNALAVDLQPTDGADYFDDDTALADGTTGNCRVIGCQAIPGVLYLKPTAPFVSGGRDEDGVHFTIANPAATDYDADPATAPESFVGGYSCRRKLEAGLGRPLAIASLLDGALIGYVHGLAVLRNVRGGKTGIDTDYRLEAWKGSSGVLAKQAFAQADGAAVYATADGIFVNDGKEERCISGRVWARRSKAKAGRGPWAYEIGECLKALGSKSNDGHFHLSVADGCIYVSYRSSSLVTAPDRVMMYDYSQSGGKSGVEQFLRGDGQPFAWSSPLRIGVSEVARVLKSDGPHVYGAVESGYAGHTTGDGRIDELDLAGTYTDNGVDFAPAAWLAQDDCGDRKRKHRSLNGELVFFSDSGDTTLKVTTLDDRSNLTTVGTFTADPAAIYSRKAFRLPPQLRGPAFTHEIKLSEAAVSTRWEVKNLKLAVEVLDTPSR